MNLFGTIFFYIIRLAIFLVLCLAPLLLFAIGLGSNYTSFEDFPLSEFLSSCFGIWMLLLFIYSDAEETIKKIFY